MKRTIITILLALTSVVGQAQEFTPVVEDSIDFVITGETSEATDTVVWWACAPFLDQDIDWEVPVQKGHFRIEGRLPRHYFIQISDDEGNDLHFVVEETPTHINLVTGKVNGSELQKRFIRCQMRERDIERVEEAWWESLNEEQQERILTMRREVLPEATAEDSANVERYNKYMAKREVLTLQNIRENKDNVIPAYYLFVRMNGLTLEQQHEFLREDAPYAHHPAMESPWKTYRGKLRQLSHIDKPFIDFEAEAPDGTKHRLSEYAGKGEYVLIDFWASWCGPCIGSFPMMKQFYEKYKERGLHIVGISCDENRDAWLKALNKHQLPWTALLSPRAKGDARDLYGVSGIPMVILIAPDGKIISSNLKGPELKAKLKEIFGE